MPGTEKILESFKAYEHFCKAMLDAYVVINAKGKILKSNPAAAIVFGMTSKQLLKVESINEALSLKISDKPLSSVELLQSLVPTRIDDVVAQNAQGSELNLTIGYYPFSNGETVEGAFLLLRDVTAETQLQGKYKDKASQSITDPLTGLFNRGHFDEYIKTEESRVVNLPAGSDHRNLSFIMGDIDHFKKINDKYGHPAGDYVIKTVAQIFLKTFRKTDIVCRYGGEEFLIILPASEIMGGRIAADKVRQSIESFEFKFEQITIPVTMSFGIAQLQVGTETCKDALARADAALYHAKKNGRNQVSIAPPTNVPMELPMLPSDTKQTA